MWPGMIRKTTTFGGGAAAKSTPVAAPTNPPAQSRAASMEQVTAANEADSSVAVEEGGNLGDMGHFTTDEDDDAFSR